MIPYFSSFQPIEKVTCYVFLFFWLTQSVLTAGFLDPIGSKPSPLNQVFMGQTGFFHGATGPDLVDDDAFGSGFKSLLETRRLRPQFF